MKGRNTLSIEIDENEIERIDKYLDRSEKIEPDECNDKLTDEELDTAIKAMKRLIETNNSMLNAKNQLEKLMQAERNRQLDRKLWKASSILRIIAALILTIFIDSFIMSIIAYKLYNIDIMYSCVKYLYIGFNVGLIIITYGLLHLIIRKYYRKVHKQ